MTSRIRSVGKSTILEYQNEFEMVSEGDMTLNDLKEQMHLDHGDWTDNSINTKASSGVRLFKANDFDDIIAEAKVDRRIR